MIQLKCPKAFCQHPSWNCLNRIGKGIRQHQMCKSTSRWSGCHKQSVSFFLISSSETYPPWTRSETTTEIESYRMKDRWRYLSAGVLGCPITRAKVDLGCSQRETQQKSAASL
ncbi:hypothetical protein AVEN_157576-1 [Araneus ventricosus]|uniref:Uncharacterized protein n=1 Tax=Araneus ventricosus TaxID=182803 RepID=A0A4Y2QQ81_ARAVE|nr:hypothetical protein AVEN_157576-1 [Araneus ventricosus]